MKEKYYSMSLNKPHPFFDRNGRMSKILLANDNEIIKFIDETRN